MPRIGATMSSTCRVAATWCARNTRAPCQAQTAVDGQRRLQPTVFVDVERLAEELLVRHGHQHRPAGCDQLVEPAGDLERVAGVLAEVVGGVEEDTVGAYAGRDGAVGERGHGGHDVGHHVVVRRAVRVGARRQTAGVAADEPGAELGGDHGQVGVGALPGVVEQVGSRRARPRGRPRPARCRR